MMATQAYPAPYGHVVGHILLNLEVYEWVPLLMHLKSTYLAMNAIHQVNV